MLRRIFPDQFDNTYRGNKLGLWLFGLLTAAYLLMAVVVIFSPDSGAQSADGVPLSSFDPRGAQTVVAVVALLGLYQMLVSLLSVVALIRYRSMVPLMYLLIVANYLGHKAIGIMKPIHHVGEATGHFVSLGMAGLTIIGLALSLQGVTRR